MSKDPFNLARFSGTFHAVLRITAALSFMSHGMMKLFGFPASPPKPGMPPMPVQHLLSMMGVAGMLELVGGALVLLGLFTRPVALLLSGEMAVAFWIAHAPHGIIPANNMGEAAYLYCFVFLWLAAAGAGPMSLDSRR